MQAKTLQCPTCGAAAATHSPKCAYCGALLKTVACPACFGLLFRGAKFCPHCGAQTDALRAEDVAGRKCPRCNTQLKLTAIGGASVELCPGCGGLWIGLASFDRICSDREKQSAALGLNVHPATNADPNVRYIKCPSCGARMNRKSYAHRCGVVMDVCRRHGIWLDRDELRRIIEFIRAGGLDRARQAAIEQLERERRDLEATRYRAPGAITDAPGDTSEGPSLVDILRWLFG